jgi:hypothetical protein
MAKKEEDINKRVKKLEESIHKQATQKIASISDVLGDLEDQVDYVKQISEYQKSYEDSSQSSKSILREALKIEAQISEYKELANDYAKQSNKSAQEEAEVQIEILTTQKDQAKQAGASARADAERNKSLRDQVDAYSKMTGAQKKAQSLLDTRDKISQSIADIEKEIAETTGDNEVMVKNILKEKIKQLKNIQEVNNIEIDNLTLSEDQLKAREKLAKIEEEVSKSVGKSLGFLDKISSTIEEIPIVGGILSKALGVDDLKQKLTKDLTKQIMGMGSTFKSAFASAGGGLAGMAGGIKSIIPMIGTMGATLWASLAPILPILLPIIAAVMLLKRAFEMDQELTDMARGLGVSKHEATYIHEELLDIAETTKVVGANSEALGKAYIDVAKSMGVTKLANAEMAETQVLLTKSIGMATEEAVAFQKMSMAGGKSSEQNLAVIKAGVESMTGGLMSYKEVAGDIAKSSKAVQASYKGNIAALTKAVVTAKKFGMTLDQTKKSADSLLDIETSLENEMKANVLTGKSMNMNKARQLALEGKSAEAIEEAMHQAGGLAEFQNMNHIQQKAIAEAAGMTVDEMTAGMEAQKNMESIAKDVGVALGENGKFTDEQLKAAEKLGNKEAKKMLQQKQVNSAQEKMAEMGNKLMVIFDKIATPLMEIIDPLMSLIDFIFPAIMATMKFAFAPLLGIADMFKGIKKIIDGDIMGGLKDISTAIIEFFFRPLKFVWDMLTGFFPGLKEAASKAIDWIIGAVKGILPDWAISLIGGDDDKAKESKEEYEKLTPVQQEGVDNATGTVKDKVQDALINPDGGLVVKGSKGSFQLDKNDSIVAGTELNQSSESSSEGGGILSSLASAIAAPLSAVGNMMGAKPDNSELVSLLKQLIAKVDQPVQFNIGGKAIDEIAKQTSVRKSYSGKVDGAYGAMA